ncbi:MAG: GIN domain-containing protein [Bacteroidales bacterium]
MRQVFDWILDFLLFLMYPFFSPSINLFNSGFLEKASGKVVRRKRELAPFTHLNLSGSFDVFIQKRSEFSVEIETDENYHDNVVCRIEQGILHIASFGSFVNTSTLKIIIYISDLKELKVSGAVRVFSPVNVFASSARVIASGVPKLDLKVSVDSFTGVLKGKCSLDLEGDISRAHCYVLGASSLKALNCSVKSWCINSDGASVCYLNGLNRIKAESRGVSRVFYIKRRALKKEENKNGIYGMQKV